MLVVIGYRCLCLHGFKANWHQGGNKSKEHIFQGLLVISSWEAQLMVNERDITALGDKNKNLTNPPDCSL